MQSTRKQITTSEQATTAQNIATHIPRGGPTTQNNTLKSTGDRLNAMIDSFDEFYEELEVNVEKEYGQDENKLQGVEDSIVRLQHALATEQQRRVESLKAVETTLQNRFDVTESVCLRQLKDLEPDIPDRITAWHERLTEDEEALEEERIQRQRAIERERQKLLKQLADFVQQLEIEKVSKWMGEGKGWGEGRGKDGGVGVGWPLGRLER